MMKIRALRNFTFLQMGRVFQVYHGQEYDLPDDEAQGFLEMGWVEIENKNLGHPGENKNGRAKANHGTSSGTRKRRGPKVLPKD